MRFAELLLASRRDALPPFFGSCVGDTVRASPPASSPAPATPAPAQNSATCGSPHGWPSGRRQLKFAKYHVSRWPDGQKVGRGHGQPYLMAKYAKAVAKGEKTVEGRPGGGWLAKGIAPDDYISFKIPGHKSRALIVRVRRVRYYNTFKAMIEDVGIYNLLPDHKSGIEDAVRVYRAFHTTRGSYAELEEQHGAVAIDIEPLAPFGVVDESELTPTTSSKLGTDDCKSPESSPSTIF